MHGCQRDLRSPRRNFPNQPSVLVADFWSVTMLRSPRLFGELVRGCASGCRGPGSLTRHVPSYIESFCRGNSRPNAPKALPSEYRAGQTRVFERICVVFNEFSRPQAQLSKPAVHPRSWFLEFPEVTLTKAVREAIWSRSKRFQKLRIAHKTFPLEEAEEDVRP